MQGAYIFAVVVGARTENVLVNEGEVGVVKHGVVGAHVDEEA